MNIGITNLHSPVTSHHLAIALKPVSILYPVSTFLLVTYFAMDGERLVNKICVAVCVSQWMVAGMY